MLGGHDLCLFLKPKWHSKFQNIKGIQITSFTSDKTVVKQSLLLILPEAVQWQILTMIGWSFFLPVTVDLKRWVHSKKYLNASLP